MPKKYSRGGFIKIIGAGIAAAAIGCDDSFSSHITQYELFDGDIKITLREKTEKDGDYVYVVEDLFEFEFGSREKYLLRGWDKYEQEFDRRDTWNYDPASMPRRIKKKPFNFMDRLDVTRLSDGANESVEFEYHGDTY